MKINSLVEILKGELQSSPFISAINNLQIDSKKTINGTLYIDTTKDNKDIELAVKNGAYCIVYDRDDIEIIDNEIAWIKVDNLKNSTIRLIRFILTPLDIQSYFCDDITKELLSIYKQHLSKKIYFLNDDIFQNIELLNTIDESYVLFSTNNQLLFDIYPKTIPFEQNSFEIYDMVEHSLFEVSFVYKNIYYNRVKISKLYINNLLSLIDFLDSNIELSKLKQTTIFKPIFIDKNMAFQDYGKSDKFIVIGCEKYIKSQIETLQQKYKYRKLKTIEQYDDIEHLKNLIKQNINNDIFYIVGASKNTIINQVLSKEGDKNSRLSLF
jgi:hypothetical protein